MKKQISMLLTAVSLFVALSVTPAHAYSTARIKAAIPFEFTVAGTTLPAGEYTFESLTSKVMLIRSTDNRHAAMVSVIPVQPAAQAKAAVRFNRNDEQYALSQVFIGGGFGLGF